MLQVFNYNEMNMKNLSLMKRVFLLLVFCTCTTLLSAQQDNVEEMRRHIRRAQTAYNVNEFEDALKEYKAAQTLAPQYPELYKAIGDVYEKLGGTSNLNEAVANYKYYLELAPNAEDSRAIQDRVYDLEYLHEKSAKQDEILDDLSGIWVAVNNLQMAPKNKKNDENMFFADFVFEISEIQKTGKYRVTILPENSRYYMESIIDKTVNIVPQKDASFNFTIADAQSHTPNQGTYSVLRLLGSLSGTSWATDAANAAVDVAQANDLPSNTQTAYMFALKYNEGKLEGLVNILQKFSNPNQQKTLENGLHEITFIKSKKTDQGIEFTQEMQRCLENQPDYLYPITSVPFSDVAVKDKWGNKLSLKEATNKLKNIDPEWGKKIKKGNLFKAESDRDAYIKRISEYYNNLITPK